ncbi:MAG: hypothetical protein K6F82_00390 [Sphaerochaetaceae bacterium]|nr:hypothetical protein [Sphaerochaetaceae bacterium]
MKKGISVLLLIILVLFPAVALERFSYGGGFSLSGTSEAETHLELNAVFKPYSFDYLNPFARIQSGLSLSSDGLSFSSLKASLNLELFKSMKNPLFFTMSNPGPWSPSLGGGISVENGHIYPYAELSLFRVLDKDYMYEWFVFSSTFDEGIRTWSVSILRMTGLY